jgi:YbbR domain-containing protein
MAARRTTRQFGDYYILDLNGNVVDVDIDPQELARKLHVLTEKEEVQVESCR